MIHLIQPRELFGPPERHAELLEVWRTNDMVFDVQTSCEGRLTFTELFRLCSHGIVNVIANSDIYFDLASLPLMDQIKDGECYALSRWDVGTDGRATLHSHKDSQDAWIFRGRPEGIEAPFTMGQPGCDNRLAYLLREAGYTVTNPAQRIKAYHLHNVAYRSYLVGGSGKGRGSAKTNTVPGPYGFVNIT